MGQDVDDALGDVHVALVTGTRIPLPYIYVGLDDVGLHAYEVICPAEYAYLLVTGVAVLSVETWPPRTVVTLNLTLEA
jgi:hypothetical protein